MFLVSILAISLSLETNAQTNQPSTNTLANEVVSSTPTPIEQPVKIDPVPSPIDPTQKTFELAHDNLNPASARRAQTKWNVSLNYSLFDMWLPSKYGATIAYQKSAADTFELEYMRGSLGMGWMGFDLGSVTEERLALQWRSYNQRNSLNFAMGLNYNVMTVHIGNKYLSSVAPGQAPDVDLFKVGTLGLSWSVGNRWQTETGWTWGADWFGLHVPLTTISEDTKYIDATSDPDNKRDSEKLKDWLVGFPRLVLFKIQLGLSF